MPGLEIKVDTKDLQKLAASFEEAPRVIAENLQRAINAALPEVQARARRRTPVITGRLKGGIEINQRPTIQNLRGIIKSTVTDYDYVVHRRNPFMQLGRDDSEQLVMRRFEEAVENIKRELGSI